VYASAQPRRIGYQLEQLALGQKTQAKRTMPQHPAEPAYAAGNAAKRSCCIY
jgi:hypothetical protein